MKDICIKNAFVYKKGIQDVFISDGLVQDVGLADTSACTVIEGRGKTLFPGFADIHTHLDKTYTSSLFPQACDSLMKAIQVTNDYMERADESDFIERGLKMVKQSLFRGTCFIRSHITVDNTVGLKPWRTASEVQKEMDKIMDLQLVLFAGDCISREEAVYSLILDAVNRGAKILGGCPSISRNGPEFLNILMDLAQSEGLDLDLHVDEQDDPDADMLELVAEMTIKRGLEGRVTAGHCTSLNAVEPEKAMDIIKKVKDAGMNIVTLPSCNLYLMGRRDTVKQRRGLTRVSEFLQEDVNISLSSDNIQDPFRPFGQGDLLEEALLTAQLLQNGTPEGLGQVLDMITYAPARAMKLKSYGLEPGDPANMVLVDSASPELSLIEQGIRTHVFSKGRLVYEQSRNEHSYL